MNLEVIVSPKMQTKNYKDFCPTKQTRIVALFLVSVGSFFGYNPCLFGRAEIFVIFGLHDLINSFRIYPRTSYSCSLSLIYLTFTYCILFYYNIFFVQKVVPDLSRLVILDCPQTNIKLNL